jgi:hypothetical protein
LEEILSEYSTKKLLKKMKKVLSKKKTDSSGGLLGKKQKSIRIEKHDSSLGKMPTLKIDKI